MIEEYAKMSYRNIFRRKRRTALTVIGIFIGISAVVALISLGQGLENSIAREFQSIGGNKIFVNPGGSLTSNAGNVDFRLTDADLRAVRNVKGIAAADGALFMNTGVEKEDQLKYLPVISIPGGKNKQLVMESWAMEVKEGRMIRRNDRSNVVIGSRVANRIFSEDLGVRSQLTIAGRQFRVVGVLAPTGDPSIDSAVILPLETGREIMDRPETYDWIFAEVEEGFSPGQVEEDVAESLRNRRGIEKGDEPFTVSTQEDLVESFTSILNVVRGVVIGISSISLFVGAVGIMNTMYTSVAERTREIGVMKAIGAKNRQVLALFMLESSAIGFLGGLAGVLFGVSLSWLGAVGITRFAELTIRPYMGPQLILGALLFSTVLGAVSGVLPARRAARMEPVDALRYE
ncbi:MAG: ABC transporter permease [Candidatus Nanohaloarchaea archaeon]